MAQFAFVEPPAELAMSRSLYRDVLRSDPCAVCDARGATIDHIQPRSRGGRSHVGNLSALCEAHNTEKADTKLLLWLLHRRDIDLSG